MYWSAARILTKRPIATIATPQNASDWLMMGTKFMRLQKDEILDRLANTGNVAQFVAFRPETDGLRETFNRILGRAPNKPHANVNDAIEDLLEASCDGSVNVRSYTPEDPRSREFVYGLSSVATVIETIGRLADQGLHLIVNETIDVSDGGVSGVIQNDTIEFSPDDTPRCVEKPGIVSLPFADGLALLTSVYGVTPELKANSGERTEFSIHPKIRGWRGSHTLLWEHETDVLAMPTEAKLRWPNHFSRLLGDKAFGLLIANRLGLPVPRTFVFSRRIAPFIFGRPTGSAEVWIRTCPKEPQPGLYTTAKGWRDPFALLANEDPCGTTIASVLRQDAIRASYSGAAIVGADNILRIEGRKGEGDRLMLGIVPPEALPNEVVSAVNGVFTKLSAVLGVVRFEWVYDGKIAWIVQVHLGGTESTETTIVPGEAKTWKEFRVEDGIDKLRVLLINLPDNVGIILVGEVGLTSHVADVVRRAGAPARLATPIVEK